MEYGVKEIIKLGYIFDGKKVASSNLSYQNLNSLRITLVQRIKSK